MANRNAEVIDWLRELAQLTVLAEQNPQSFRARSYDRARHGLEGVTQDLSELSESALQKLDGIGKSTAKKIREYFETGKVDKLEKLRERYPESVVELSRIPGIGPKTLARMRADLGIEDLDALKQAIDDDRLKEIEGLGTKSQEKIAQAIDRLGLKHGEKRTPLYRAMRVADQLVAELKDLAGVVDAVPCGSLRRHRETVGDLDIVVASSTAGPIMDWFAGHPLAKHVVAKGETKTSIVTRYGLQVDLRVVTPDQLGAAVMYFTGSKDHNIRLRQRALQRGWTLNEYALTDQESGEIIASTDEASIYAALELPYIEPPLREDTGEIEAATDGSLPEMLKADDLLGDLHVHTDRSGDGRSSLLEMVQEAERRGYTYLAITDHAENLPFNGVSREELERQADEMEELQERFPGIRLLKGCELNIDRDGGLDYDDEFRATLDWCIAAVHSHYDLPQAKQTDRLIRAIQDPAVRVVGHLTGRMIGSRPGIDLDIDAVLDALVDRGGGAGGERGAAENGRGSAGAQASDGEGRDVRGEHGQPPLPGNGEACAVRGAAGPAGMGRQGEDCEHVVAEAVLGLARRLTVSTPPRAHSWYASPVLTLLPFAVALATEPGAPDEAPATPEDAEPWDRVGWGWGGVPAINFNSDEGFGFGVLGSIYRYNGGSQPYKTAVTVLAFATTRAIQYHYVQFDTLRVGGTPLRLDGRLALDATQVDNFCGIGPDVTCDPAVAEAAAGERTGEAREQFVTRFYRTRYLYPRLRLNARYALDPMPHRFELFAGFRLAYILPGDFSESGAFPGSLYAQTFGEDGERGFVSILQLGAMLDNRDNEPSPTRGYWIEGSVRGASRYLGSDWEHAGFNTTLRGYVPLFTERLVFADRIVVDAITGEAPVQELAVAGGSQRYTGYGSLNAGRGIRQRRFVGETFAMNQAELRWLALPLRIADVPVDIHVLGFVDVGFVGAEFRDFGRMFRTPLPGGGGGLRFAIDKNFIVRADVAFSSFEQGNSLYIDINNLF